MKFLIKLILGIAVLGIIAIGAVAITLAYLDPNDYKDTIASKVKAETGRDLRIDGNIGLTFYPWLGLDVEGVSLSNASGFGDAPFLQTKTIKARAKLLPLLRKELEMDTLVLHGATINLAKNAEGVTNWDDLVKPKAESSDSSDQAMPLAALVLGGIDIKDANIHWRDMQQGVEYKITNANIGTGELKLGEPIDITADLNASASKPALSSAIKFKGTVAYADGGDVLTLKPMLLEATVKGKKIPGGQTVVKLSSEINVDVSNETAQIKGLELSAFDTEVKGQVDAAEILSGKPQVNGNIDVNGKDLPQLFKIFEIEPLASQLAKMSDKTFKLSTTFNADMNRNDVDVSKLDINLLGNKINAEIAAHNVKSKTPAAKGKLTASGPDLPALIKIASQLLGDGKQDSKLLSKQLSGAPKSFDIKADFDADLKSGSVDIPSLSIKALGMVTTAKLNAKQVSSDTPSVSGELKANGPDLPLLMQIAGAFQAKDSALPTLAQDLGNIKDKKFNIDTRFNVDMKSGKVDLPSLAANALGFNLSGNLKGDNIQKSSGNMGGKFTITSKSPKPLLRAVGQADLAEVLQSIDINTGVNGNTNKLSLKPLSLNAVFAGKKIPNSPVKLSVKADSNINLEKEIFELSGLSVTGLGLDMKGAVKATNFKTEPVISGDIALAPFDLRQLMKTLNQEVPKTADPKVLKRVALASSFSGTGSSLNLKGLKAELDETKLQGDINLKSISPLDIEFGLGVDKLNADRYLPPATKSKKTKAATPETVAAGVATKIPVETLRAIKIKGDFVMGEFVISNAKLTDLELSIRADQGDIKLAPVAAKLYEGSYAGDIYLDAKGKEPKLTMNTKLTGVQTGPLLTDVTGKADLLGEANVNLALNSSGADTNALKGRLSGTGDIKFNNGTLKGVDIPKALKQIEIMYESKRFGKIDTAGETKFNSLTGTLDIKNGIVDNHDLLMDASGFKVKGDGMMINLNDETWKYNMNVLVDSSSASSGEERYNLGGYDVLIKCRGKIVDKKCVPDIGSMIEAVLKDTAKEKVQEVIGDKLDKLGIKLPGLKKETQAAPQQAAPAPAEQQAAEPAPKEEPQPAQPVDPVEDLINKGAKKLLDKLF
jgi:AsmA protein